ncbi:WYL domain-containing protein [Modestobacter sp. VKM Ac-2979]|uniref:helix-turn-helix transcriptional regulator n=1 Tax=unclassified Modestobacter TaxID=2643866 RepID=UPI0022AB714B|nr:MULTISPECIES: WYL domain-containing protein [unclassified Modestobacter]MCZ2813340.1 WYL domain-containing protein [Modestobacter sp. VKM Ac-2979]MCZ2842468.1 WYL domain-containing protein [Modestobacter sp. VKM Ac-2980]
MTRPTARVLALLEILQTGGMHTVGDLAARLGVDERTVRRYVGHLVDLEIPVETVRGRYGGVRLVPGYRMPPLMLTGEEALAVVLGLVAGRRAGLVSTSVLAVESAAAKLRRVLPTALSYRLEAVLQTAGSTSAPGPQVAETTTLLAVAEAARDRRAVDLAYVDGRGRASRRTVHPYGIVAHAGRWYLTGADASTGEARTFRMDRVAAIELLPGTFEVPAGFDGAAAVVTAIAEAPRQHVVYLIVDGTAEQVRRSLPATLATVEEHPDDSDRVRVLIRAERLDWVPGLLAAMDLPFHVEGPDALRPMLRALAQRLTTAAEPTP